MSHLSSRITQETFIAACHSLVNHRLERNPRIAIVVQIVEFIQVALFIIHPVFQWNIDYDRSGHFLALEDSPHAAPCPFAFQYEL